MSRRNFNFVCMWSRFHFPEIQTAPGLENLIIIIVNGTRSYYAQTRAIRRKLHCH